MFAVKIILVNMSLDGLILAVHNVSHQQYQYGGRAILSGIWQLCDGF
jgi:hypothetical protein